MSNNNQNKNNQNTYTRINEQIRCPSVMLVDGEKNLGNFVTTEALRRAREAGLDLVEVAPLSRPPVCKIMDYGKFKYEQALKDKEKRKKQKQSQNLEKEVWLSPSIGEHDLLIKINHAKKFLEEGHRVHLRLKYKRRENAHRELGFVVIQKMIEALAEIASPQSQPKLENSKVVSLNCILDPKSK